jgi:GNAT superfamily N-acetyltransferase
VNRCAAWMSVELARGAWRAWVATQNGRIVGQIWLQVLSKLPNPADEREQHAYISNVYVTPSARGGVGTPLLRTALEWARSNGIDRVVLWPTARSRTMYERRGFRAAGDVLEFICS